MPPLNADERTTLESWLDFHRATLAIKCAGLNDRQAVTASVPPSAVTLTGLVQQMAEVERNWFREFVARGGNTSRSVPLIMARRSARPRIVAGAARSTRKRVR